MSKFYAKFKETDDEIIVFKTQQERDDWVNFKDEFSILAGCTKENSTLEHSITLYLSGGIYEAYILS